MALRGRTFAEARDASATALPTSPCSLTWTGLPKTIKTSDRDRLFQMPMSADSTSSSSSALPRRVTLTLQALIGLGLILELYEQQWLNAAIVAGILLLTALPAFVARGTKIIIPPQFELLAIAFIFASLYLGERRGFYARFWWWDLALHSTSGVLLGILGFLLVYILNQNPRIDLHMQRGFVAFFAFCFSLAVGALWEIFEFAMDRVFGMNMQKPMFGDPSGLTDTMWDLIVDAMGTFAVVSYGYHYMRRGTRSLIERWIGRFIEANPRLFS